MKVTTRILLLAWTCMAVLAGVGLGVLLLHDAAPVSAEEQPAGGASEGPVNEANPEVYIPSEFIYRGEAVGALPNQTIYYAPLDSNNHNTILMFYNTNSITATIDLDFQSDTGSVCGSGVVFNLPPGDSARVSADSLDAGRPSSWANTIIYNMFDTCEIGLITMPNAGVQVAGYYAWTATDIYNPRELNPHAEVRFSSDPFAIFLPSVESAP